MTDDNAASTPDLEPAGKTTPVADTPHAEPVDDKPDSLDDVIDAAINASKGHREPESPSEGGPDRDEKGRFKAKDEAGDDATADEPGASEAIQKVKLEPAPPAIEAPAHWSPEDKALFARQPADVQQYLLARHKAMEADYTRKSQELSESAKYAASVKDIFSDNHRQHFAAAGMDEAGAMRQLLSLYDAARENPVEYAKWFLKTTGVTPDQLGFSTAPAGQSDEFADPDIVNLRRQVETLPQTLDQMVEQRIAQHENQRRAQELNATLESFKSTPDGNGGLKYPHFDRVRGLMAGIYTQPELATTPDGPARLAKAYDLAVAAHPEIGPQILEARWAEKEAKAAQDRQTALHKAKAAAPPVKNRGTVPAAADMRGKSLDDVIDKTIADITGRA